MPGPRLSKRKSPSDVVVLFRAIPVSVFVTVTPAPGTDAPFGSIARPAIVADPLPCPCATFTRLTISKKLMNIETPPHILSLRSPRFLFLSSGEIVRRDQGRHHRTLSLSCR